MPTLYEFIKFVSSIRIYGDLIVGMRAYERLRPLGWPTANTILKHNGYTPNYAGWCALWNYYGYEVVSTQQTRKTALFLRGEEQARKIKGFDYRNPIDEQYLAVTWQPNYKWRKRNDI